MTNARKFVFLQAVSQQGDEVVESLFYKLENKFLDIVRFHRELCDRHRLLECRFKDPYKGWVSDTDDTLPDAVVSVTPTAIQFSIEGVAQTVSVDLNKLTDFVDGEKVVKCFATGNKDDKAYFKAFVAQRYPAEFAGLADRRDFKYLEKLGFSYFNEDGSFWVRVPNQIPWDDADVCRNPSIEKAVESAWLMATEWLPLRGALTSEWMLKGKDAVGFRDIDVEVLRQFSLLPFDKQCEAIYDSVEQERKRERKNCLVSALGASDGADHASAPGM